MSYGIGAMEGERNRILRETANRASTGASGYQQTVHQLLDKIQNGEADKNSSGVAFLNKINGEKKVDTSKLSAILAGGDSYTNKMALTKRLADFQAIVEDLQKTAEGSYFLKSAATDTSVYNYFDISCKADGTSFTMDVKRLATEQRNEGTKTVLSDACQLGIGRRYFDLTMDGKRSSLVVKLTAEDTNESAMNKIVDAINRSDAKVTAELKKETDGTGYIAVSSNGTGAPIEGEEYVFYFSNLSDNDVVSYFGLNNIAQQGQDALFNFNNSEEDSTYMFNSALVNGVVSVDFKAVTNGPVEVSFDYDYDGLCQKLRDYVSAYNSLKQAVVDGGYGAMKNYFGQLVDTTTEMMDGLSSLGISLDVEGTMYLNEGFFYKTDMSELKTTLNKAEKGYAAMISKTTESMNNYMNRLTGKTRKYYGLRAKKSNAALRAIINQNK